MAKKILLIIFLFLAKEITAQKLTPNKTMDTASMNVNDDKDLGDIFHQLFHKHSLTDSAHIKPKKYHTSFIPAAGYALQTGWAALVSTNIAFQTSNAANQKVSSITSSLTYSQYKQIIFPFVANIWTKNNKLNFTTDIRFIQYPSAIYGLGGRSDPNQGYTINFTGLKFHQSIQKEIAKNFHLGMGYYYDQYWNIQALDSLKQNVARRLAHKLGTAELASGIAAKILYDSRLNQINPQQGFYANVVYRPNFTFIGSNENWQSLLLDARTYISFPKNSKNVVAFWGYTLLTVGATTPPYLMLPSVGWDDNYNTGRGYIQGRFRGKDMYYFETEYRYKITHDDLLRGVIFCNVEKFSGDLSRTYTNLKPGYGLGLRIKLNKISGANICLDYGFGNNGSHGFFVNIGEVF